MLPKAIPGNTLAKKSDSPKIDWLEAGNRLVMLRRLQSLSRIQLSQMACVPYCALRKMEYGAEDWNYQYLLNLVLALHTTMEFILIGQDLHTVNVGASTFMLREEELLNAREIRSEMRRRLSLRRRGIKPLPMLSCGLYPR